MTQESTSSKSVFRTLTITAALLFGASFILSVHAQSYKPACTNEAAYASVDGKGLYVDGGAYTSKYITNQAFTIDLSRSWNTRRPLYQQKPHGYANNHAAAGVSSDRKWWTLLIGNLVARYNADTNTWYKLVRLPMDKTFGVTGITDPATDVMYVPFAHARKNRRIGTLRIDLRTGKIKNDKRSHSMSHKYFYSAAWNSILKSVIYVSPSGVFKYTWAHGWDTFTRKGLTKIGHRGQCLVSVNGGKKMVLFGGISADQKRVTGDIFILDVEKRVWAKGPSAPPGTARTAPSCAGSNGQVVIWGGSTSPHQLVHHCPAREVLVFSVHTNKWTNKYVAP
jgi:hypothetical protein